MEALPHILFLQCFRPFESFEAMKRRLLSVCAALTAAAGTFLTGASASAQQSFFDFSVQHGMVQFTFDTNASTNVYFDLESTPDLLTFTPIMISFPSNAPGYQAPATNGHEFFSVAALSIYAPQTSLGQGGVDDVFLLNNGLNPLSTNVSGSFSGHYDTNGNALTWLQYYNQSLGRSTAYTNLYGREFSVFNTGGPFAPHEAISREVSTRIIGFTDVASREVSAYNGGEIPTSADIVSREVSVFNTGQSPAHYDITSREVSVQNTMN
jgi:hypothetical protein